jgi:hypothetical protein
VSAVTDSRRARAAVRYAALGWRVLPLHTPDPAGGCSCQRENCAKPGKHPRSRHGARDATTRAETINLWWSTWPDANVGVATGEFLVIDVDGAVGDESLQRLQSEHGQLPTTLEATTARGRHLYFTSPSQRLGNSAGRLGDGLDVRGHGGYVVAPPSLHPHGHRYRWRSRRRPGALPAWVVELLTATPAATARTVLHPPAVAGDRRRRYFAAALRAELPAVSAAQPGTRNHTLNRAAFRLAQLADDETGTLEELQRQLLDAALTAGLSAPEARATIASGLTAGQQHPRR